MMKKMIGALGAAVLLSISARAEDLNARIAAVAESGGGKVSVGGVTRMEGPLELKSGVELHLEDGAEIVFSGDPKCYPVVTSSYEGQDRKRPSALVTARDAKDVAITGKGTFRADVGYWHSAKGYRNPRPQFFQFSGCRNLRLEGFRVRESPSWTIHVYDTKDVVIRNLDVIAHGRNTDGIDIDSTENVLIENCRLDQGDDGFVMKSGKNAEGRRRGKPTRNVTIRNCTVVNGHTLLGIGSELSGGIENIRLENCIVEGEVWRVLLVKTNPARGGYARDIHVKGVKAARAKCAVFEIMEDYFWWREQKTDPEIVRTAISDVSVEDVVCDEAWYAYDLRGDAALKPRDVTIRNCTVKNPMRDAGRAENIENLTVENVTAKTGPVTVWCDDADARYRCGDTATFTVRATTNCTAHVRLDNFGDKVVFERDVRLEKGRDFTLTGGRDIPGFLLLTVRVGKTTVRWGAAFDPEKITAGAACPDDFDEFWREAIAKYDREVPVDVKLEPLPQLSTNGCDVSLVSLSDPKGRTVYGFLSVPQGRKGPFPARMHIPGAGPSVGLPFCGDRETIGLTMNVHYYRPVPGEAKRGKVHNALQAKEDAEWQAKYPAARPRYTVSGIAAGREDYFYYGAFLAINRAANWLWNRPDVRRDDFSYSGGSQGGGSGLALLALNGRFTRAAIHVPALTAHLCQTIDGREAGWPRLVESQLPENREAAARNAPYFDGVNFASRVTCPIRFSVGFIDTVAPPHAGYAAFNVCPSKDKAMVDSVGFGHSNSKVDSGRISRWFRK